MTSAFPDLLEALGEGCPICHEKPMNTVVLGQNDIRLQPCGHAFDAQEWLEEQYRND